MSPLQLSASALPHSWVPAAESVTHDLAVMYSGPVEASAVTADRNWQWESMGDGLIAVGMTGPVAFLTGNGFRIDARFGEAAVVLAHLVQDHLAGYEYALWPAYENAGRVTRTLTPGLRDGTAVWLARGGAVWVPIGGLRADV
ncbi:hypothetical protein [Gordonia hydrophobica]|uniref:Uncharacterized protein n=1 Tax=Gordonia hydrophobica TaxID=40516 RepID=A0ABZ2U0S8_9ACTN|nr:hypothetical protein [Gordonia hydrophobica]MBM7366445.1 hypothetical protein [Gordonia hydrophobica]